MERTAHDVDQFLAELQGRRGDDMRELDRLIVQELGGLERALWEGALWSGTFQRIIGYGAIEQPRPRGASVRWFLVGLAAQKSHLSVYVNAVEPGAYLVASYAARLGRVKVGAAAITLGTRDSLDDDGFVALLRHARQITPDVR
ncbi:hypothetical protein [Cellulomonas hominis]